MAINTCKPYPSQLSDDIERYPGNQPVYLSWDPRLIFAAAFITRVRARSSDASWVGKVRPIRYVQATEA